MNNRQFNNNVPVREGEELTVTIEAMGEKGDGIAKKEGFVIFIPNTQVNETVKIRIARVLSKQAFGEVIGKGDAGEEQQSMSDNESQADSEENDVPPEDSEDFGEEEKTSA